MHMGHPCFECDQSPDEWDATVASATTGSADDYSHMDDEQYTADRPPSHYGYGFTITVED